ncbi:exopolysaccharide biosynthesis protein [Silicimonas algicola]|uniref:Exopolysaccharide synthesis protein ExoD n=1 Tax=Silicimonas algicola TaxID=1826607 RepID=A0A316G6E4_9RHOB|nr:exopolysaccharide biosynthesis protein [Silicimonas algicola]AZQ66964.1 exopolysaccharide biosynthesis protein [Silicimonas algicola]PWK55526.1 hypothetical protein C8D95_107192 [Silicimonas algicola]
MKHGPDLRHRRSSLALPILRTTREQHRAGGLSIGGLLTALGDSSFGWAIVLFALLTFLPLPPGSSLVTALPLLGTTLQMTLGYRHVRLPSRLARVELDPKKLRRTVLRLRPVTRRLEKVLSPRFPALFGRSNQRLLGTVLFVIAFALFLPVPGSGWFPAISLLAVGIGLVERDGLTVIAGVVMGLLSVALTAAILVSLASGAEAIIT